MKTNESFASNDPMRAHLMFRLMRMLNEFGIIKEVGFDILKDIYGTKNGYNVTWRTKTKKLQ